MRPAPALTRFLAVTEKVLIVSHGHPEISPGGAEIAAYSIFRTLRQIPQVEAVFLAWTGEAARPRGGTPFSVFRGRPDEILFSTETFDHFLFSQPIDLAEYFGPLLRRVNPDVIHLHHYSRIGLEFLALARRLNPHVRIIMTLHEYLAICNNYGQMIKRHNHALCYGASPQECSACFPEVPATDFLLRQRFIQAHFEKVDLFVAPSEFLRQRYIAWGIPDWQITVLDNGTPAVTLAGPRPLADGERRGVFGFFGQMNMYKGLLPLLTAFEYIAQAPATASAGMRLIVHGANLKINPPEFIDSVTKALGRNLARVHYAGPYQHQDIGRLMAAVDWVVVPSIWWENSPLVIQEAFAHRRPVICSNIGGMAEKVVPGRDGFHFQAGNPFELARLLLRLAVDVPQWDRLQSSIRQPMTVENSVSRLLSLYRDRSFAVAN
jgi:glycosyltransferase involved in cell wall biosynthesis